MTTRPHPQNKAVEQALLGGLILHPSSLDDLEDLQHGDFYDAGHAALYALLCAMYRGGEVIDMVTVPERVARENAERYGGVGYVIALPDGCPSTTNLARYAGEVRADAARRRLISACYDASEAAYDGLTDPAEVSVQLRVALDAIGADAQDEHWKWFDTIVPEAMEAIARRVEYGETVGPATGFDCLDDQIGCLGRGDLVILAGRPSMGKTALALQIAEQVARQGIPVGVQSLEMERHQLIERALAGASGVPVHRIRHGGIGDADVVNLREWAGKLEGLPIAIDDTPGLPVEHIEARARRLDRVARQRGHVDGLGLLVVDYIQLMKITTRRGENRAQAVAEVSRSLKQLARAIDCPVLALSQLSRGLEMREDKRPKMSDLRDSGGLEQDADLILFVYREEVYNADTPDLGLAEVLIAKQRQGRSGAGSTVPLFFDGDGCRFSEYSEQFVDEWRQQRRK